MSSNTDPSAPPGPIASSDVAWTEFSHGQRFALRYRHLTLAAVGENYRVGVAIEELPPGKQTCPFHYHMLEEEHVLVLDGECTLRLGEERNTMKAGDYVCFPAGRKVGHCLINETEAVCRYVIIGENNPNEVTVYPDSSKVQVRWLGERYDRARRLDYWDREE